MNKFALGAIFLLQLCSSAFCQNLELPKLPYDYNALEPAIDEATMKVHHLGHHAAYLNTINAALSTLRQNETTKYLAKMGIDKLLQHLPEVPQELAGPVRNGGGGFVNHVLFWNSMRPGGSPLAEISALGQKLVEDFGSFDTFRDAFTAQALRLFGAGWAWLVADAKAGFKLEVATTPNQDTPAMHEGRVPLLGLDVWEHAYYLKYQNKRGDYIAAWWSVVDWAAVEARYQVAVGAAAAGKGEL